MAVAKSLLRKNAPDLPVEDLLAFLNSRRKGRTSSQQSSRKRLNNYWRWTAMNGERYPGESLPFEPSMRHADGRVIAIIEYDNL